MQLLFHHFNFSRLLEKDLINPFLKTPTPLSISNTRPLAIFPEQSTTVERDAFNQLLNFLEDSQLLEPRQACYHRGHSTETALAAVTEDIRYAIKESKVTILNDVRFLERLRLHPQYTITAITQIFLLIHNNLVL